MSTTVNDSCSDNLPYGIYEALLDEGLRDGLLRHPELRSVLSKIDPEEQPSRYAAFIAKVIEKSLLQETDPLERLNLCNRIIDILAGTNENTHLEKHKLVFAEKSVLSEITPPRVCECA